MWNVWLYGQYLQASLHLYYRRIPSINRTNRTKYQNVNASRLNWARRCSNYIWVVNKIVVYQCVPYTRSLTVGIFYWRRHASSDAEMKAEWSHHVEAWNKMTDNLQTTFPCAFSIWSYIKVVCCIFVNIYRHTFCPDLTYNMSSTRLSVSRNGKPIMRSICYHPLCYSSNLLVSLGKFILSSASLVYICIYICIISIHVSIYACVYVCVPGHYCAHGYLGS